MGKGWVGSGGEGVGSGEWGVGSGEWGVETGLGGYGDELGGGDLISVLYTAPRFTTPNPTRLSPPAPPPNSQNPPKSRTHPSSHLNRHAVQVDLLDNWAGWLTWKLCG